MILRVNVDDEKGVPVEELLYTSVQDAEPLLHAQGSKLVYPISSGKKEQRPVEDLEITARASVAHLEIVQYESGSIRIYRHGVAVPEAVKTLLRPIATEIGVDLINSKGGLKNTQQLGVDIIRTLNARSGAR